MSRIALDLPPTDALPGLGRRSLIMGIVNATPDSFSGDGVAARRDPVAAAVERAAVMIAEGADMLDIGGESTRPGSIPVSAEEEKRRVLPVLAEIRRQFPSTPLSIDTMKAEVAAAALAMGVAMINDVSALGDPAMAPLAAKTGAYLVLMHNRGDAAAVTQDPKLGGQYEAPVYANIVADVARDLARPFEIAVRAGVAPEKVILDPGLGFGKTAEQNCTLIRHIDKLGSMMKCRTLLGPSRKGFIGRILDASVDDRLAGTAASVAVGVFCGANILRVHDVKFMARVAKMAAAIRAR
ncbi:MAG TPA: dihydropteroate synthase [Alphaproteobacteria bacterium]|nr:dihydropteroate synthase [Alphaproteobacteria bacterium]